MKDIQGQVTLSDWFQTVTVPDFPVEIARHIVQESLYWSGYALRLPAFEAEPTYKNFLKLFCSVSRTFYVGHDEITRLKSIYPNNLKAVPLYNCTFEKDGFCYIKITGKDFNSRDFDAVLPVGQVLDALLLEIQTSK